METYPHSNEDYLHQILNFREDGTAYDTNRDKGDRFEAIAKVFLENDATYSPRFEWVKTYSAWAQSKNIDARDVGIDLVAKNAGDALYTAIQCKAYDPGRSIDKKGIDSFIAASDNEHFSERLFFDTTDAGITGNVKKQIDNTKISFTRVGKKQLAESSVDWKKYARKKEIAIKPKKTLRPHQKEAVENVLRGFETADRGKLIMACGTGKTFTALKIAETLAGKNKTVLFLAPSLALVSQTLTEWTVESSVDLQSFAVCSDAQVGKRKTRQGEDDGVELDAFDLAYPATTSPEKLAEKYARGHDGKTRVVFATYQSIQVIGDAQSRYGLPEFDLIVCDEAHRTSGVTLADEDDSHFVKVHDKNCVKGKKRLYMTATPRIFIDKVKKKAQEQSASLCSMDDEEKFGKEFHLLNFGQAVEKDLLSDYKVLVLALDEARIERDIQSRLAGSENNLELDDATKIVGCYKALAKIGVEASEGKQPVRKAIAFCRSIKKSKTFGNEFEHVVKAYRENSTERPEKEALACAIKHLDGTMDTARRNAEIGWLKERTGDDRCRILTNARCLSEGVDVPSLDAVVFVHSRRSKIDIVQAVGRVMRKAEGKRIGYVILPVVVPAGVSPEEALGSNKNYEIVWDVLNALRSHDERMDSEINRVEFGERKSGRIEIVHEVENLPAGAGRDKASGIGGDGAEPSERIAENANRQIKADFEYDTVQKAILAKIVQKCGTRTYWENWASDIAAIAEKHIEGIQAVLQRPESKGRAVFDKFLDELRKNLNESVTEGEVVEMIAQHMITRPVFDALFADYDFNANNPVSQTIQRVVEALEQHRIGSEADGLKKFYDSVRTRVQGVESDAAKQKIIVELYDKFFRKAFPKLTERLGIVYTPVECVDFIVRSVNDVLRREFDQSIGEENIHVIDPFTGTGTFIVRLLQSGLIPPEQLERKFTKELHANEIVLLAYYIATVNIESAYHDLMRRQSKDGQTAGYRSFPGICLTDTFQLYENDQTLLTPLLPVNSDRLNKQKDLEIKVIIGNPPYSAGQKSGNDDNPNLSYPKLDESIETGYAKHSMSANKNSLYDSYIRAIRWASDRVGENGVIGLITNAGWIDSNAADGMRQTLQEEFSDIYVFHLRGNARTQGEQRKKEAGNIFSGGSRAPIAISVLVKNSKAASRGNIRFYDIGDYHGREQKLKIIDDFAGIDGIAKQGKWQTIRPDRHHDWINQRSGEGFYEHMPLGDKKTGKPAVFANYSNGVKTNRDAWVYNASKRKLEHNVRRTVEFYNAELERYHGSEARLKQPAKKAEAEKYIAGFVEKDATRIAFSRDFSYDIFDRSTKSYQQERITHSLYRPYCKTNAYYDSSIMMELYQMPKIFPESGLENLVIGVSGKGANSFSCLVSDCLVDLHLLESQSQCFPLKLYERIEGTEGKGQRREIVREEGNVVTAESGNRYRVSDGITDEGLWHFGDFYQDASIGKEDLFYYVYGLLHSEDYRTRFANHLTKGLPHLPRTENVDDFRAFSKAGRELADLHLNYETKEPYPVDFAPGQETVDKMEGGDFYVKKMRFASKEDKSSIVYNDGITVSGIPLEAYGYVVNGRSAIEWVMERQRVTTHKDSGIVNDPNDWARETKGNPRYPLDLLLKVITISLKSVEIVKNLPKLPC